MTRITLYEHPLAVVAPQEFEVPSLALWLLDHYGAVPTVKVQVFAGQPSASTEITDDVRAILAGDAGEYVILQSPAGFDPFSWTAIAIYMVIAAVAVVALIPKPVMPGNINRTQQSPNNALGSRQNKVRMLERVEDIYGTVKSIPSLMMPTYDVYINHQKFEVGYYCVSRGYCDLTALRDGDTLLSDIGGSSAAVYLPFTSPNSGAPVLTIGAAIHDPIVTARRAVEVDGITLRATNQVTPPSGLVYTFGKVGIYNRIIQASGAKPNFNSLGWGVGDTVVIANATDAAFANGTWTVQAIGDGTLDLTASAWTVTPTISFADCASPNHTYLLDWVTLPDANRTEVWFNITAPNGLFADSGGGKAVNESYFQWFVETLTAALVPTGTLYSGVAMLDGTTSDPRAMTLKVVGATGPVRCRLLRFGNHNFAYAGTLQDEIKWADCYSISPVTKTEFGNKTTIHTVTQATTRATAVKSRQLNCIASRKLPIFNGTTFSGAFDSTGRLVSGTIAATSKLCDIIAAVSVDPKIGARNLATEIDMAQIWGVQQALDAWSANCGQFNYTFDSDNASFEETLILIANAGFCLAYRQNGKIRLAFDKAQPASTALFTHRNKKPKSETITRSFASDSDYDGVQLTYVDPDSDTSETISLPLDASATKYRKFEIAGIRNFTQAWYRASREYAKLRGQRITLETTTTLDARSLLPNSRIDVVDNTRFKSYDGEVVGQSGLELTLSQDVAFAPALPHSIVLMRRDGSLQSIPVTAGSASNRVLLQSLPSEAITTTYGQDGIRTIYSFAADSARGAMAYLVQEIDISDGQYCTVRAINYSSDYYAGDVLAVPAKATVIN